MTESKWNSYVGVKLIQAHPATDNEFRATHGRPTVAIDQDGYAVLYPDGYESWSPKEQFEKAYLQLTDPTRITLKEVEGFVAEKHTQRIDPKTCLVRATMKTEFVEYGTGSCVDPANYDENMGSMVATKQINDRLWHALGFVLQWAKKGLK